MDPGTSAIVVLSCGPWIGALSSYPPANRTPFLETRDLISVAMRSFSYSEAGSSTFLRNVVVRRPEHTASLY
jgi:hypothetical protein